jgi:GTP-binding protein EngB required for normal cell division
VRLADVIGRWIGKVEIVLAGADDDLREGEDALAAGDAMRARAAAHRVLAKAPESPLGLALLADACEAAGHLDAELALTLEQLSRWAPSRAEVWVRLARVRWATHVPLDEVRDAFARALAVAESGSDARLDALVGLADLDLAQGEGTRADLWLERVANDGLPDVVVRRAEVRLLRGDPAGALQLLEPLQTAATDGRAALARGRALAALDDPRAFPPLVRAMVLDEPGSSEALSSALARIPSDDQARTRVRSVVDAKGEQDWARWRAAFARAEGARDAARRALRDAVDAGDTGAARPLVDAAIDDHDSSALDAALSALPRDDADPLLADARLVARAARLDGEHALDAIAPVGHARLRGWADRIAADVAGTWIPRSGAPASWTSLLARIDAHAHAIGHLEAAARAAELAADRSRPVRLAIVGEFNAGKSTFINALIGADVAPTGILPTTAMLHHLRWAPDSFAEILFEPGHRPARRIVGLAELRPTLADVDPASVARVEIRLPLAALVRVEILDTPGFNAPDARHADLARAAFEEADIAFWLLDATQTLKESERAVLAEADRARLPVQILVNKADRLSPPDLARVMGGVLDALADAQLTSWRPPIAFSAKRALAAKLAGHPALDESGWSAVETLIENEIVGRSEELKERALRRRASALVSMLLAAWSERGAVEAAADSASSQAARQAAHAAARLDAEADELAIRLAEALEPHARAWARDVDLVFVGRDRDSATRDPVLARYRIDRALASLAPPLSRALASLRPEVGLMPAQILPAARAIVRAAAGSAPFDVATVVGAIARASIATLSEQLFASSAAPPGRSLAPGVLRELSAFAEALRAELQ